MAIANNHQPSTTKHLSLISVANGLPRSGQPVAVVLAAVGECITGKCDQLGDQIVRTQLDH